MLLFLKKYNNFTCSLHIINYTKIQKFSLKEVGGKHLSHPFIPALRPQLSASEQGWGKFKQNPNEQKPCFQLVAWNFIP